MVFTTLIRFKPHVWQKQVSADRNPTLGYDTYFIVRLFQQSINLSNIHITAYLSWRWTLDSHGYEILPSQQNKTKCSFFFSFSSFAFRFDSSKFVTITKNNIHVLVECFESSYKTKCANSHHTSQKHSATLN